MRTWSTHTHTHTHRHKRLSKDFHSEVMDNDLTVYPAPLSFQTLCSWSVIALITPPQWCHNWSPTVGKKGGTASQVPLSVYREKRVWWCLFSFSRSSSCFLPSGRLKHFPHHLGDHVAIGLLISLCHSLCLCWCCPHGEHWQAWWRDDVMCLLPGSSLSDGVWSSGPAMSCVTWSTLCGSGTARYPKSTIPPEDWVLEGSLATRATDPLESST